MFNCYRYYVNEADLLTFLFHLQVMNKAFPQDYRDFLIQEVDTYSFVLTAQDHLVDKESMTLAH